MGQVFTDKVDVTKLKEGAWSFVQTATSGRLFGVLAKDDVDCGWWLCTDELENADAADAWCFDSHGKRGAWGICDTVGYLCLDTEYLELLDADHAEKMQAEHAEMLTIIEAIADPAWSNGEVRNMARDFLTKRKDAQ